MTKRNTKPRKALILKQDNTCKISNYVSFEENFKNIEKTAKPFEDKLIKAFGRAFSPSHIKEHNDFYTYVNYNWIKETEKSSKTYKKEDKYFTQVDTFRLVQNKVYIELMGYVKEYIRTVKTARSAMIKNVYTSLLNLNQNKINEHILKLKTNYDSLILRGNLWEFLASINKNPLVRWACPISWKMMTDEKNSEVYIDHIEFPQLSLYDYMLYFVGLDEDTPEITRYKKLVQKTYLDFISEVFVSCLGPGHGLNAQDVFDIEVEILTSMGCDAIKNDSKEYYNLVKKEDALSKYGFDWEQFSTFLGYDKAPPTFICPSLNYLKCICDLMKDNWNTPKWKAYWFYIYLKQIIRFDSKRRVIHYNFYEKFLSGQQEIFPREIYPIFGLSLTFNTFLTEQYELHNRNDQHIDYVNSMSKDLLTVFKRIITKENHWLTDKTRKNALLKLEHLKLEIARPKKLREDPLLSYTSDDAWGNMEKLAFWKTQKFIELRGKKIIDIPEFDWKSFKMIGTQAYIVNAFYIPNMNKIYIPMAYLQKPFIDLEERGIEYNLAAIGYTLCHEMSHSLDEMGSKYDYKGNLNNWWLPQDKIKYKKIINDVIYQYQEFAKRDGIDFDASVGIGEDMADIAGLWICVEFLRDFQIKNKDISQISILSFKGFFVYYAYLQRQLIYKSAVKAQLKINPHPMNKYRTNIPLTRIPLFRDMYNVKKGNGMWWPNTCSIWDDGCSKGEYKKLKNAENQ